MPRKREQLLLIYFDKKLFSTDTHNETDNPVIDVLQ